jgi:phage gp29-like protein
MRFGETKLDLGTGEIATRSRSLDGFALGNMYLPNPDPVLKKQGKDITVYTDLITDDRVGGSMINRINATLALDWDIDRGKSTKSRKAKFIKEVLGTLPLTTIIEHLIRNGRAFGYGPAETLWHRRGDGLNAPHAVEFKPQRWFVFSQTNELRFLSRERLLEGEELPARRFLCPTNEASYENPYGLGLNSRCFWPVVFKRGGWRFRVRFAEKYGTVWPVGKLPRSATPDQVDDLLGILEAMINDGVAVIPDDGSVSFLESGSKGSTSDMYHSIIADADSAISTVWLGHAGAGQSTSGELGGKDVASEVRRDLRDADKTLVEQTMNRLIDWICEENWGTSADAPRFCLWEEEDVDLDQAKRDTVLSAAMEKSGLKLSRTYYLKTYNLDEADIEDKQPAPQTPPNLGGGAAGGGGAFADAPVGEVFPDQTAMDTAMAALDSKAAHKFMLEPLKPVIDLINSGADLNAVQEKLLEGMPQMTTDQLEEMLTRAFFVADVWGRLHGQD